MQTVGVSLSDHGCSTRLWGNWFWNSYLSLAANMDESIDAKWIAFFFKRSFGSTGPCEHCCKSHRAIVFRPENSLDRYVLSQPNSSTLAKRLVRWVCLIKYHVNTKLNKPIQALDLIEYGLWRDPEFPHWWTQCFFNWLYCQAIMFPVDVSPIKRMQNVQLAKQYQDFVHFFTQLKNVLPRKNSSLAQAWIDAYYRNPPNANTFSSRHALFLWLYQQHTLCMGKPLKHSVQEMGKMFEGLRSQSCGNVKQVCM